MVSHNFRGINAHFNLTLFFQILIATITYLLPTTESSPHELDKRVSCSHSLNNTFLKTRWIVSF